MQIKRIAFTAAALSALLIASTANAQDSTCTGTVCNAPGGGPARNSCLNQGFHVCEAGSYPNSEYDNESECTQDVYQQCDGTPPPITQVKMKTHKATPVNWDSLKIVEPAR